VSSLWIPDGNNRQTELDIKIAELKSLVLRMKNDLTALRTEIEEVNMILLDVLRAKKKLKQPRYVVSIREYKSLKIDETLARLTLKDLTDDMVKINKRCELFSKKILELQDLRSKLETKILRFPDENKKRP